MKALLFETSCTSGVKNLGLSILVKKTPTEWAFFLLVGLGPIPLGTWTMPVGYEEMPIMRCCTSTLLVVPNYLGAGLIHVADGLSTVQGNRGISHDQ